MDLGIIKGHYNIFIGEVQTGDDALFRGDLPRIAMTALPPGCLDLIPLLEVRTICGGLRFTVSIFPIGGAVQALCP
jgi:hypothetical protein